MLTPELIKLIADVVRMGNYLDTAAIYCGVSKQTFHNWMKKGHDEEAGLHRDFLDALEQARAEADLKDHARIARSTDWKAAVEHLRLRNPSRYSRKALEHTGKDGAPISVVAEASLLDMFNRLLGEDDGSTTPPDDDAAPPDETPPHVEGA